MQTIEKTGKENLVKQIRKEMNLSKKYLVEKSGVSMRSLIYVEENNGNPSIDTLYKIATALGKSVREILA